MSWPVLIAAVLAVWAALRVLGNERQRLMEYEAAQAAALAAAAGPAGHPSDVPVVS